MKLIRQRLENLTLVQTKLKDDGNCQFRSIAHQMWGNAELHMEVREAAVRYLKKYSDDFSFYFEDKKGK